jgi:hypothetical protein
VPAPPAPSAAATTISLTSVTTTFTLFSQVDTVTAHVTSGGVPVTTGQVTFTDAGQTKTVSVSNGTATTTFTLSFAAEQPNPHGITASYSDTTGAFASGSTAGMTPNATLNYFFQLYLDLLILQSLGL